MRGFEDSTNPVNLWIDDVIGVGVGPFQIDGAAAEAEDYGIRCEVSGTRYFIPWGHVRGITQVQAVAPPESPPVVTPPNDGGNPG